MAVNAKQCQPECLVHMKIASELFLFVSEPKLIDLSLYKNTLKIIVLLVRLTKLDKDTEPK